VGIVFDKYNKLVVVEAPDTDITIQELVDAIRDWQDELANMETDNVCNAYGKQDLGAGLKVGITLELINDWRIAFEDRAGPTWTVCTVLGGNLVAINVYGNNPIYPATYVNTMIAQSSSATLISASGAALTVSDIPDIADAIWDETLSDHLGSGATGEALNAAASGSSLTYDGIADSVWDEAISGHISPGTVAESLDDASLAASLSLGSIAGAVLDEIIADHAISGSLSDVLADVQDQLENKLVINEATSELWLYDDAGSTVIKKWPITDKDGGAVVLQGTGPANREKRTL